MEDGDSGTRSSFDEETLECEDNLELADSQDPSANEVVALVLNIPDSVKHLLEEDVVKIKYRKKV